MNGCKDSWSEQLDPGRPFGDASQKMERTLMEANSVDAEWKRLRDDCFARLDAIKARSGEGEEFFAEMARQLGEFEAFDKKHGLRPFPRMWR